MWFKKHNRYFCGIEKFAIREINRPSFSNPHPRTIRVLELYNKESSCGFCQNWYDINWFWYVTIRTAITHDYILNTILGPIITPGMGLLSHFVIFLLFQNPQNTCYLLNIMFIFDRCRHSWATITPVKYTMWIKESNWYSYKTEHIPNWEINKWSFSNSHPPVLLSHSLL